MKKLRAFTLSLALAGAAVSAQAQTVDEVVDKHVNALGGAEKIKSIHSQVSEGTMAIQGMEIPLKVSVIHKKGMRVEFEVMGTNNITVITPTSGWLYMPVNQQPAPVDADENSIKEAKTELDLTGELFDYKNKGNKAELAGKETEQGQELYKIRLTRKDSTFTDYFLDANTYYVVKKISKKNANGQEVEVTENISNYKKTGDGYVYAETFEQQPLGMKMTFSRVQINSPVDEKIFEKPKDVAPATPAAAPAPPVKTE